MIKRSAVVALTFATLLFFAAAFMTNPARAGSNDAAAVQAQTLDDATFVATSVTAPAVNPVGILVVL